ncbi:two-component sensor histidine kinase [Ideonella dechloratans]|uniref:Virulence sensor protein BvgS n=1 Tax=Ideonella dechloratans TaxID=36863 RepID=A0A643FJV1_IDEDE|nr:hybrid sensor histidine kinase/response regulator [Ideonella dechloratans]KAB0584746.1 two-component sensor histidine kinase [Ideonella dechloratans]UFU12250.1 ATP-binding protein [Ideonella dechloratans]
MPHRQPPSSRVRLSVLASAFAALLLVIVWLSVFAVLASKRNDAIEAERRQNVNVANVLGEQTLRVIATLDQACRRVADAVAEQPDEVPDLIRFANETGMAPRILAQLSLVGADGRFVGSNLDPDGSKSKHVDLSTREHVRVHLDPATLPKDTPQLISDGLFIGKPVLGKVSGKWTIQLSRKISDAQGRTLGVVVASLDPSYFEDVYRGVDVGPQGVVALIGADLNLRARVVGGQSKGMGTQLAHSALLEHLAEPAGSYLAPSNVDGLTRLTAFRRVAAYPLDVTVGTSMEDALAAWNNTRTVMLTLTAVLSGVVLVATVSFVMGLRRLERTNDALRVSEAQAQAASRAKSDFLAAISHELRTPLTSIRGFAELMELRLEQPKFREQAGLIRKGAEHLNDLLTEILDFTKLEAGAMPLNAEPVALRPLIDGTANFFAIAAAAKGLNLTARVAEDVPEQLSCDGLRLKQILNNLLSNAVKFTPEGQIQLLVERDVDSVLFQVQDTGPGIPPEMQEAVFERFRQGNARVSYEHGGTGLGLALARGLAELMEGELTLVSRPGEGACFTLRLPLRQG